MPKEHKKRGRREERKRKRGEIEDEEFLLNEAKWQQPWRMGGEQDISAEGADKEVRRGHDVEFRPGDLPFYGLLDEQEQEYFKQADLVLEMNQFAESEERGLFLANVYREANGKELKIANSQSCSRLMERLILLSSSDQLKTIFQKFRGQYVSDHFSIQDRR